MRFPLFTALAGLLFTACTLLVHFDPEGQPCDEGGGCLAGYVCKDGRCRSGDGNPTCTSCPQGQVCDRGTCVACSGHETRCDDGEDDDCDGQKDCADSDCVGIACDDRNPCTSAETCQTDGTCGDGTPLDCSDPPNECSTADGTCDPATGGCVYPPVDAGVACEDSSACTSGDHCDGTGQCVSGSPVICDRAPGTCFQRLGVCAADAGCLYTPQPRGTACDDGNPCTIGEACDDTGTCSGGMGTSCVTPPNDCYARQGTCVPGTTMCTYTPLAAGTACSDGNACTVGDKCNGAGVCTPGPSCPSTNACKSGSCVAGACVFANKANGTSCGTTASKRCCTGTCVDISSNTANCGGCGNACASGFACESIAVTTTCTPHTANTTGRCRCQGNANCPHGQVCTTNQTWTLRCAPATASNCGAGQVFHDLPLCPNYCSY